MNEIDLKRQAEEPQLSRERALQNTEVINEIEYPPHWTETLAKKWATEIPAFAEYSLPETPIVELDLTKLGLGKIGIKDESRLETNPTGTIKDHMARRLAHSYKRSSEWQLHLLKTGTDYEQRLRQRFIPRYSIITSGNTGLALAVICEKYNLPPPKLLLDISTPKKVVVELQKHQTDIYLTDLSSNPFSGKPAEDDPLEPTQIKYLTNNEGGFDLTYSGGGFDEFDVSALFYGKLSEDALRPKPDEVYVPVGGAVLYTDLITMQCVLSGKHNLEWQEQAEQIKKIKILGAEPEKQDSIADKLTASVKPFMQFAQKRLAFAKNSNATHLESGIYKVTDEEIKEAWEIMKKNGEPQGMRVEPSAAAGMALYIKRKRAGLVKEDAKIIVINTGCGVISERAAKTTTTL